MEDKLPKMVCSSCSKTLEGVHKFASMAIKMQEKLNEFLKIQSEELSTKSEIDDDEDHSGSLLHSILTNVSNLFYNKYIFLSLKIHYKAE